MDSLELEIRRLLSKERGISIERISTASRLGDDLGMDGDDAVEFFQLYIPRLIEESGEIPCLSWAGGFRWGHDSRRLS